MYFTTIIKKMHPSSAVNPEESPTGGRGRASVPHSGPASLTLSTLVGSHSVILSEMFPQQGRLAPASAPSRWLSLFLECPSSRNLQRPTFSVRPPLSAEFTAAPCAPPAWANLVSSTEGPPAALFVMHLLLVFTASPLLPFFSSLFFRFPENRGGKRCGLERVRERGKLQGGSNFLKAFLGKVEVKKAWAAKCFLQLVPEAKGMCLSPGLSLCGVRGGRVSEARDMPSQVRGTELCVLRLLGAPTAQCGGPCPSAPWMVRPCGTARGLWSQTFRALTPARPLTSGAALRKHFGHHVLQSHNLKNGVIGQEAISSHFCQDLMSGGVCGAEASGPQ